MSSTSETGHAKNVANFEKLITYVIGYGDAYNPSNATILLSSLQNKVIDAKTAVENVNNLLGSYNNTVGLRSLAFEPLAKLSTRVFNALKASTATKAQVDSAETNHRKLQGRRASAMLTDVEKQALAATGDTTHQISASQLSYDSQLDSLDKQIKFLTTTGVYTPNETALQLGTLSNLYADLMQKNADTQSKLAALSSSRISRNEVLYHAETGMVAIATNTKNYAKSLFGITSPQYKQISAIAVRKTA